MAGTVRDLTASWIPGFLSERHLASRLAQLIYQHWEVEKELRNFTVYLRVANGHRPQRRIHALGEVQGLRQERTGPQLGEVEAFGFNGRSQLQSLVYAEITGQSCKVKFNLLSY